MNKEEEKISKQKRKNIVLFVIVILVFSFLVITRHHYVRLTADAMLYFSIAQKYLSGDFHNAINGYWGPLLSWLMLPFLYFGASDIFTINALNLIFGVLTIAGTWFLSYRFEITEKTRAILIIILLPVVLKFSLVQPMDFLLVCIVVFYLNSVFDSNYNKKVSSGYLSGLLGSMAYLTKAYAFPFYIVHFLFMNVFHYIRSKSTEERAGVIRNALAGFVLFALLSGTWIVVISSKYGYTTFSTMRQTNFNAPGPDVVGKGLEFGVPVFYEGFFAPPNEKAFIVWEDPSYLRGQPWSAWQSWRHFKHFIKLTFNNITEGLMIVESFSTVSIAIIIIYILLLINMISEKFLFRGEIIYPLFTIVLFSGGYILFHFEERYMWLVNILLLLMGGHVITLLFKHKFFERAISRNILIGFFLVSFILNPVRFIYQTDSASIDKDMYDLSMNLKKYSVQGNIASNRELDTHEAWHKTFRIAYWLQSRYYGQAGVDVSDWELEQELKKFNIDYYFVWGERDSIPQFLHQFKEITNGDIVHLRIYHLRDKHHG